MCAPADYDALQTCVSHLAELLAVGLGTFALHHTIRLLDKIRTESVEQREARLRFSNDVVAESP